jgi:two-component system, sensor histidine kinase PdtaS
MSPMQASNSIARRAVPYRQMLLLALGYAALAYLGSLLYTTGADVAYFWPANALALVALCRAPRRQWLWLLAAAGIAEACVNLWFNLSWLVSAGLAAANMLECVVAAWLIQRFDARALEPKSLRSLCWLVVVVVLAPAVSAWPGAMILHQEESFWSAWLKWWSADGLGLLLLTPAFAALANLRDAHIASYFSPARLLEVAALAAGLVYAAFAAFGAFGQTLALRSIVFPFLIWAVLRFHLGVVAWALVAVASVAVWAVIGGHGAFDANSSNDAARALAAVQAFLAIAAVTTLSLAAVLAERRSAAQRFQRVVDAAPNGIMMIDATGHIAFANAQLLRMFGYVLEELVGRSADMLAPPGSRATLLSLRAQFLASPANRPMGSVGHLNAQRKDGSPFDVEIGLSPIDTADGPMILVAVVDISARKEAEQRLRAAYAEKEVLLKEVYHRVKNNLQIVSALISLQAKNVPEQAARDALARGEARIHSMALVHEQLYQSQNLATLDVSGYITTLVSHLSSQFIEPAHIRVECDAIALGMDQAIPCGLIITELVTNACRHAFVDGRHGEIAVRLRQAGDGWATLEVSDNGVGLPEGIELAQHDSFGWVLVQSLAQQLGGGVSVRREHGTAVQLRFPVERKVEAVAA